MYGVALVPCLLELLELALGLLHRHRPVDSLQRVPLIEEVLEAAGIDSG